MEKEIKNTIEILKKGGVILYPTDTIWGIGCDATDEKAVSKVYTIKQREESKSLIILVSDMEMLKKYIQKFPTKVSCVLNSSSRPTTVIYKNPKELEKNTIANDNTIAIRIANDEFCSRLINKFKKPIVSTSANYSGKPSPKNFDAIDKNLKKEVDYIVNLRHFSSQNRPSQLIRIDRNGKIEFLRK